MLTDLLKSLSFINVPKPLNNYLNENVNYTLDKKFKI